MKKPLLTMLIILGLLFGGIFGYKIIKGIMMGRAMAAMGEPAVYVSAIDIKYRPWQSQLKAVGSVRAVLGVNVTTELAGMVKAIYFTPGATVKKGDLLAQLNIDPDIAGLHVLEANAALAAAVYKRDAAQYKIHAISKAVLDSDEANLKSTQAQVTQQTAVIAQKTIRAPFDGRLGISTINPGQYINPGDTITMLQTIDPVYVDFYVPQQALSSIKTGQSVVVQVDTFPNVVFNGVVSTINPALDSSVRNVKVEATIQNPNAQLTPGMFASVTVDTGNPKSYLTLPLNAVTFNPYGESVYIVNEIQKNKKSKAYLVAKETFVVTGEKRDNQVMILKGLKEGDKVVTSGQIKLKNGSKVVINEIALPENDVQSTSPDE
ncbi:MAG: mdtE [Gammaproteobacteria bacterium]|jgi:membrane fusion protein (multidrug efflux system)|nr:mdtE [Gammaproteobacteria bacterium]